MSQIDPLQDALESLHWQWNNLHPEFSQRLHEEAPSFVQALELVTGLSHSAHVPAPPLGPDDRAPESLPPEALYISNDNFDMTPPARLKDVWQGRGDVSDIPPMEAVGAADRGFWEDQE